MISTLLSHRFTPYVFYGLTFTVFFLALGIAYQHLDPPVPKKIKMAAGEKGKSYYYYAQKYAKLFARYGIEIEIIETKGSMENLALMSSTNDVDIAFMQGGITTPNKYPHLNSLGSMFFEPLWVFYNETITPRSIRDFIGKTIAIGPKGSGTNFVLLRLLEQNGINNKNTNILEIGIDKSEPALLDGTLDALGFFTGEKSDVIQRLSAKNSHIKLLSIERADAYASMQDYLSHVWIPQGGINLAEDIPAKTISLISPTANLVVKDSIHPAIMYLFLLASKHIHAKGDIFSSPGQFPNDTKLLFPLSIESKSFYEHGPPFFLKTLPYRMAISAERLKIFLLPLLVLIIPLFKITPAIHRWRRRRKIFKWYDNLKKIELESNDLTSCTHAEKLLVQLKELDLLVVRTSVPSVYANYKYSLRVHIRFIQDHIKNIWDPSYNAFRRSSLRPHASVKERKRNLRKHRVRIGKQG